MPSLTNIVRVLACVSFVALSAQVSQAAIINRTFTVAGINGTTGYGSFSYDTSIVGPEYDSGGAYHDELTAFSMSLENIGGNGDYSASYALSDVIDDLFFLKTDETGMIIEFGVLTNFDYTGDYPVQFDNSFTSNVRLASDLGNTLDTITYTLDASSVPEPSTYASLAGAAVLVLAACRRSRQAL